MIVIGTRGSDLALTQSRWVAGLLQARGIETRLELIKTQGDRVQHLALNKLEGKGFFTKEIEEALLAKRVDFAVHSLKDLPGEDTPGLTVAAIPEREDVRDCLVIRRDAHDPDGGVLPLKRGARVGTSAVRRKAQLVHLRPDLVPEDLRGNVPTRVRKLDEQPFDAIVLAQAGLSRLGLDLSAHVAVPLPPTVFVPAPGQGALALQCRKDDHRVASALHALHHAVDATCVAAERALLLRLNGGCHLPLGAHAVHEAGGLRLHVFHGDADDARRGRRLSVTGDSPAGVAEAAFEALQRQP
jgi:hydroxymethylbilane synthase